MATTSDKGANALGKIKFYLGRLNTQELIRLRDLIQELLYEKAAPGVQDFYRKSQ